MFELFSDFFASRDNVLSRMDPRPKLVIAFTLIVTVVCSGRVTWPLMILVACVVGMLAVRIAPKFILMRLAAPMAIVVVLIALQSFLTGATPIFSLSVAGHSFTATTEGVHRGLLLGSRVLGAVSVVLLLSFVTPAHRIFHALRCFGVPDGWVEIALLVYRYTFILIEQAADVATAQRVRLGYSTLRRSWSSMGVLAGTVVLRSLEQGVRTHEAMMLRGYAGSFPLCPLPVLSLRDRCLMYGVPVLVAPIFVVWNWWPM